jgi:hypothetical protein
MSGFPNWFPVERCDGCGYNSRVVEHNGEFFCYLCWEQVEEE